MVPSTKYITAPSFLLNPTVGFQFLHRATIGNDSSTRLNGRLTTSQHRFTFSSSAFCSKRRREIGWETGRNPNWRWIGPNFARVSPRNLRTRNIIYESHINDVTRKTRGRWSVRARGHASEHARARLPTFKDGRKSQSKVSIFDVRNGTRIVASVCARQSGLSLLVRARQSLDDQPRALTLLDIGAHFACGEAGEW